MPSSGLGMAFEALNIPSLIEINDNVFFRSCHVGKGKIKQFFAHSMTQ